MPVENHKNLTLTIDNQEQNYQLIRTKKRKRTLSFDVESGPTLVIRAPARTSVSEVEDMIRHHIKWIKRRTAEIQQEEKLQPKLKFITGERIPYLGNLIPLEVIPILGQETKCEKKNGKFDLYLPISLNPDEARECSKKAVASWFKSQAEIKFAERVEIWKNKLKVEPGKIIITDPKTRWGSCDVKNNIRLSWRILMAPLTVVDYLVAHELCHVVHRNHGPRFWKKLEKSMPDCIERRNQLKMIGSYLNL